MFFARFLLIFTHRSWYQVKHFSPCLSHCLEENPRGPAGSFPKLNNSPPPRGEKEIPKLYHSPRVPVGSPGVSRGSTHGKANDKCIIMVAFEVIFQIWRASLHFLVRKNCFLGKTLFSRTMPLKPF